MSALFATATEASADTKTLSSRMVVYREEDKLNPDIQAHPRFFPLIGKWLARQRSDALNLTGTYPILLCACNSRTKKRSAGAISIFQQLRSIRRALLFGKFTA
jgi:hypothetical protein